MSIEDFETNLSESEFELLKLAAETGLLPSSGQMAEVESLRKRGLIQVRQTSKTHRDPNLDQVYFLSDRGDQAMRSYQHFRARKASVVSAADLSGLKLQNLDLTAADFSNARLKRSDFSGTNLTGSDFSNASCEGAVFVGCDLRGAAFLNSKLSSADFRQADLRGADFTGASIKGARFQGAKADGTTTWPEGISAPGTSESPPPLKKKEPEATSSPPPQPDVEEVSDEDVIAEDEYIPNAGETVETNQQDQLLADHMAAFRDVLKDDFGLSGGLLERVASKYGPLIEANEDIDDVMRAIVTMDGDKLPRNGGVKPFSTWPSHLWAAYKKLKGVDISTGPKDVQPIKKLSQWFEGAKNKQKVKKAMDPKTTSDDLDLLARESDPDVRFAVLQNVGVYTDTAKRLMNDPDSKVSDAAEALLKKRRIIR